MKFTKSDSEKIRSTTIGIYNRIEQKGEIAIDDFLDLAFRIGRIMAYRVQQLSQRVEALEADQENKTFFEMHYDRFNALSPRECEIMKLVCMGYSSRQISARLFISINTVSTHRRKTRESLMNLPVIVFMKIPVFLKMMFIIIPPGCLPIGMISASPVKSLWTIP